MDEVKVLYVLTARGGSKGVPGKNIKELNGLPLLAYRILSAQKSVFSNDILLSTDSSEIKMVAERYSVSAPFFRSPEYATDEAKCEDAVYEILEYASKIKKYQYVCMLQPTSPFTRTKDLDEAIRLLDNTPEATALVSTRKVYPSSFYIQQNQKYLDQVSDRIANVGLLRRQDEKVEVTPSGNFYFSRVDNFLKDRSFYRRTTLNFLLDDEYALEIDENLDFEWAKFLIQNQIIDLKLVIG